MIENASASVPNSRYSDGAFRLFFTSWHRILPRGTSLPHAPREIRFGGDEMVSYRGSATQEVQGCVEP